MPALLALCANLLAIAPNKIFVPYSRNSEILETPTTTHLNSFKSRTFQYIAYDAKIENIKNYYKKIFSGAGYTKKIDKKITKNKVKYNYLQFTKDDNEAGIWLSKNDQNDVNVLLIYAENNNIENSQFRINKKKDNPGFDL